jgi:hypothetical protein
MRVALATIFLSLISTLVLQIAPRVNFTDAALCLQPVMLFGPGFAVAVLVVSDVSFRSYFLRPNAHKRTWACIFATTIVLLLLSLIVFHWAISDPTSELEGASIFWGHPMPWIMSGYFYAGFGGEFIRSQGGYRYIFLSEPWYTNLVVLFDSLVFDLVFFFAYSAFGFHLFHSTMSKVSSPIEAIS